MMKFPAAMLALAVFAAPAFAAPPDIAAVEGLWLTGKKDAGVELYRCENHPEELCGRLHWLGIKDPSPNEEKGQDIKNPDKKKRGQPLCGMQFVGGFEPDEDGSFSSGWLYNPRNGFKYSGRITPQGKDKLLLRGYIIISAIGEEEVWTREPRLPECRKK
ncbi:MAG: DUF2147 domain-containing protein [Alphaproteobacteria bacterium]|nr:DUF2147 domain-containing protein [Alphaproteobacteria bacterium]